MLNIFIDEAGDQGFSFDKGSSRHFLIGFAYFPTTDYKKCVDSVKKGIAGRCGKEPRHLHFNKSSIEVRKELLVGMVEKRGRFGYIFEDKEKVYDYLRSHPTINYNYNQMVYYLIENLIISEDVSENIAAFISQRSSDKKVKKGLSTYLSKKINKIIHPYKLYPTFVKPHSSRGADCADFVCGSIYKMIEKTDRQYYDIIHSNVIVSKELFKK